MRVMVFDGCLVVSTFVNVCLVMSVMARAARRRPPKSPALPVSTLVLGACTLGLLVLIEAIPVLLVLRNPFAVMHLVYVNLVVTCPAVALLLLLRRMLVRRITDRPAFTPSARVLTALALLPAGVGVYASWIEPTRLEVVETPCTLLAGRGPVEPLRVAVLADLQFERVGDHEHRAVTRALAEQPDLILLPGDLYQGHDQGYAEQRHAIRALLGRLQAPGGVFLVEGDVDRVHRLQDMTRGTQVQLLHNECRVIALGATRVALAGLGLRFDAPDARAAVARLEDHATRADVALLLAHRPAVTLSLSEKSPIDLVVAGHTHGGQVVLPGFGPPVTLSPVPRRVAAGGLHRLGNVGIYVSRGVGMERGLAPRIRFLCRPEVSVLVISAGTEPTGAAPTEVDAAFD